MVLFDDSSNTNPIRALVFEANSDCSRAVSVTRCLYVRCLISSGLYILLLRAWLLRAMLFVVNVRSLNFRFVSMHSPVELESCRRISIQTRSQKDSAFSSDGPQGKLPCFPFHRLREISWRQGHMVQMFQCVLV